MAQVKSSGSKATGAAAERRSEACQRGALPGRRAGAVGGAVGGGAGHVTRTDTAHCFVGGGRLVGVAYANSCGSPANRGARGGAGLGPDAGRRAGSGRGRLELAERFCSQFLGLRIRCVRLRETGSSGRPAEVRLGPGAAAFAGARRQPLLRSVLHASGACPAPEQQQSGASLERRQQH